MNETTADKKLLRRFLGLSLIFHLFFLILVGGQLLKQPDPLPSERQILRTQWHSGPKIALHRIPAATVQPAPAGQPAERPNLVGSPFHLGYGSEPIRQVPVEVPVHHSALNVEPMPMPRAPLGHSSQLEVRATLNQAVSPVPEVLTETVKDPAFQVAAQTANHDAAAKTLQQSAAQRISRNLPPAEAPAVPTISKAPGPIVSQEIRPADPMVEAIRPPAAAADIKRQPPSQPQLAVVRPNSSYSVKAAQGAAAQTAVTALTYTREYTNGGLKHLLSSGQGTGSREPAALSPFGTASGRALSGSFTSRANGDPPPGGCGSRPALAAGSGRTEATPSEVAYTDHGPRGRGDSAAEAADGRIQGKLPGPETAAASQAAVHSGDGIGVPQVRPKLAPLVKSIGQEAESPERSQVMASDHVLPRISLTNATQIPTPPDRTNLAAMNKTSMPRKAPLDRRLEPKGDMPLAILPPPHRPESGVQATEGPGSDSAQDLTEFPPAALEVIRQVKPRYPPAALRQGKEGVTELLVKVSPEGVPLEAVIASSSGRWDLDHSAVEAVKQWLFTPYPEAAEADGRWVTVQILFKLED